MSANGSAETGLSTNRERFYITDPMPVEMYIKGNHRIYLDTFTKNAPKFEVKALIGNRIATITNDTTNGLLSEIRGNSKKQLPEDTVIYFDEKFIYWLNQQGIETESLLTIENDCGVDNEPDSGIHKISQAILDKVEMEVNPQNGATNNSEEK